MISIQNRFNGVFFVVAGHAVTLYHRGVRLNLVLIPLFVACLFWNVRPLPAQETVILQLKWHHQFQFAGYYAAAAKGYYDEAGLRVLIREGRPDMDLRRMLVTEQVDYLTCGPDIIIPASEGVPIVVLAAIFQHSPLTIIAKADSDIRQPSDLAGNRVMYVPDTGPEFLAMCIDQGVSPREIIATPSSTDMEMLLSGGADAIAAYLTNEPYLFRERRIPIHQIRPIDYGIDFYGDCLCAIRSKVENDPKQVDAFVRASLRGWEYAMNHPAEMVDIIIREYRAPKSRAHLLFEANAMRELILPKFIPVGTMNPARWRHIADTLVRINMMRPGFDVADFIYDADASRSLRWLWWVMALLFAVVLAAGLWGRMRVNFNRRLQKAVDQRTADIDRSNAEMNAEIAQKREIEERLRKYELMVTSSCDFMGLVDRDYRYLLVNATYEKAFRLPVSGIIGRTMAEVLGEERFERIIRPRLEKVWAGGTVSHQTWYDLPGMGRVCLHVVYYPSFDPGGIVANIVIIAREITRMKKLEEQLSDAQKMEALGTLAGGVAHDFNNVLMGIQGRTSLMQEDRGMSPANREHLKSIEIYVSSAKELTYQLLNLARGGKCDVRPTNLTAFIREEINMFARTHKETAVRETYAENLHCVEIDQSQFRQVLLNLFINAIQAMPDGGKLYIRTENAELGGEDFQPDYVRPGKYVKISVTDTGIGMDEATRKRIFEPFFTTKEKSKGTGLGLSMTYGIVQQHEGFITVYSEKGEGTTFNIFLPASEKMPVEEKAKAGDSIVRGAGRILLIDDEEMILDVGQQMLEYLGYTVVRAESGRDALRLYETAEGGFDMVILDMMMPNMSGADIFERLKVLNPEVRVLLSSGYSANGKARSILEKGCNGFIQKPFNIKELSWKVRGILDGDILLD